MSWSERIPNPPADDIIKGAIGYETEGYIHQLFYHYPKKGGYQALSEAWAKSCQIRYGFDVAWIDVLENGRFLVSNGQEVIEYSHLISTMPVHLLAQKIRLSVPPKVEEALKRLIVNPMYIVSFGIRGTDSDQFTAIYFPEPDFLVNRISYPCTFSPENGPSDHYSIQAEITCTSDSSIWRMTNREILDHVREGPP
jgi:protoporphyrinogen oxidase